MDKKIKKIKKTLTLLPDTVADLRKLKVIEQRNENVIIDRLVREAMKKVEIN